MENLQNLRNKDNDITALAYDAFLSLPEYIVRSPLEEYIHHNDDGTESVVYIKDETAQPGHSFKDRGAAYAIGKYVLMGARSVVTVSAGNHGLGVARAAQYYDIPSTVVVPKSSELVKKEAIRKLGSKLIEIDGSFSDAESVARSIAKDNKSQLIHPFADPFVAAGQGTIGIEVLEQLSDCTSKTFVPVGGGGLLLGYGSIMKNASNENEIVASQPIGTDTFSQSFKKGMLTDNYFVDKEFGGLAVSMLDSNTFVLGSAVTDYCVQVSPLTIFRTMYRWKKETGITLEPAAVVGLAASLEAVDRMTEEKKIVTILTGSNSSLEVNQKIERLAAKHQW
jgi:threonine dehydratase